MVMQKGRQFFYLLRLAAEAHARWEIETSTEILRSRKKLLILLALALPALGFVGYTFAAGTEFLGGKEAYAPSFYSNYIFIVSIFIGLCAGLITGCIGAGGGFVITPALMSAGVKGILAVGTDLFHIFAKAIMGTAVHRKLGNVSVKLAITFLVGSTVGVVVGGTINRAIYDYNPVMSDLFISLVYVFLLGFLGIYAMADFIRLSRAGRQTKIVAPSGPAPAPAATAGVTGVAQKLQSIQIPPMISFDEDVVPGGNKIAGLFVVICGFIVGMTAAIMGVGGGFLTFPMFVYLLGVSSFTTVGTDILQIIITAGFGAISQYAIYGFIFYTLAMGMLLGSLLGIQVGGPHHQGGQGYLYPGVLRHYHSGWLYQPHLRSPQKTESDGIHQHFQGAGRLDRFYRHDHLLCDGGHLRVLGILYVLQEHQRLEGERSPFS